MPPFLHHHQDRCYRGSSNRCFTAGVKEEKSPLNFIQKAWYKFSSRLAYFNRSTLTGRCRICRTVIVFKLCKGSAIGSVRWVRSVEKVMKDVMFDIYLFFFYLICDDNFPGKGRKLARIGRSRQIKNVSE